MGNTDSTCDVMDKAIQGDDKASLLLAQWHLTGDHGVRQDITLAEQNFEKAHSGSGLNKIAVLYFKGANGLCRRDPHRAVDLWKRAAEMENAPAMCNLGRCYQSGMGVKKDAARAVSLFWQIRKQRSHWLGDICLALCYLHGEGVDRNPETATSLLWPAAREKRDVDALAYLGWCHLHGCGAPKDAAKAVDILSLAAAAGGGRAMVFLGECHAVGAGGVRVDANRAAQLFADAVDCDGGREAFGELGLLYHLLCRQQAERNGGAAEQRAAVMFEKGASAGDPIAMFHLGVCLRDGRGVRQSMMQSMEWLEKAANIGHTGAAKVVAGFIKFRPYVPLHERRDELEQKVGALRTHLEDLERKKRQLQTENEALMSQMENSNEELRNEERIREEAEKQRYLRTIDTMISLISANICNFTVEKLLGVGQCAAAFRVQYTPHNSAVKTAMVMKVLFNWDGGEQTQTLLRRKYMAECVTLSSFPRHENIVHPLGAIVVPGLPTEYMAMLAAADQLAYPNLERIRSLVILMPWGGIPLSSFLLSQCPEAKAQLALRILAQGLSAIIHLESHHIVHRGITDQNIVVDEQSKRLTLIDFGEAVLAGDAAGLQVTVQPSAPVPPPRLPGAVPPELCRFAQAGGHGTFSYSKCDSFSLALALYDALLPASNKFIGSEACSRCHFSTETLRASFPLSLGPVPAVSSVAPACTGCTAAVESSDASATLLVTVLIEMMKDNKADRLSAQDALQKISKGVEHKSSV